MLVSFEEGRGGKGGALEGEGGGRGQHPPLVTLWLFHCCLSSWICAESWDWNSSSKQCVFTLKTTPREEKLKKKAKKTPQNHPNRKTSKLD